ncbi:mitochondrial inner membrane protein OXA1L-like [Pecten maximus]|uniref:mitochondrial inner membrane protein OXA1L-like n=1 Tax=Pecten maximus TaxID=6579 RepID=UPI001458E6B4|nr:mitochondrial inner membrane protein OXA1L-like [Pecten maximus]
MAALRHVRVGSKSRWINLLAGQNSSGHFLEATLTDGALNTIQKRWLHPANFKNCHATGSRSRLLSAGLISSQYGARPTWSVISAHRLRYNSTEAAKTTADASGYILEPPALPDIIDVSQTVNALGEPSLASMGLGSYWPPGLYQQGLEYLHVGIGLPWWEAIVLSTVIVRVLSFPLLVMSQRFITNSLNHKPEMDRIQAKLSEAKINGNVQEYAIRQMEMKKFMRKTNSNPLKTMMYPMMQMPIFLSVFIGLRKMAYYPVESMSTGGVFWFSDLTVSDPYFILPVITSATLLLSIELGSEGISSKSGPAAGRYFMRAIPLIMVPIMMTFPAALNGYWLTSNVCGLVLASILRQKDIRKFFKIPQKIIHPKQTGEKKSFKQFINEAWSDSRRKRLAMNKEREKREHFKKAGAGPLTKTYATDPTIKKKVNRKVL